MQNEEPIEKTTAPFSYLKFIKRCIIYGVLAIIAFASYIYWDFSTTPAKGSGETKGFDWQLLIMGIIGTLLIVVFLTNIFSGRRTVKVEKSAKNSEKKDKKGSVIFINIIGKGFRSLLGLAALVLAIWFIIYLRNNHLCIWSQPTDQAPRYVHNPDAGKPHERKVIDSYQTIQTIGYGTVLLKANTPYKYLVDLNISNGTGRDHFFTKEHADGVPLSSTEIKNGYLGPAGDHFAWGVYELKKTTSVMVTDYKVN